MNKDVKVVISSSMVIAASTAMASANTTVSLDNKYVVSDSILDTIEKITNKKDVNDAVSESFNSLILQLSDGDKRLAEKYFAEYMVLDENGDEVVNFDVAQISTACSITSCYSNCYSNCHGQCHSACHGSRGWR